MTLSRVSRSMRAPPGFKGRAVTVVESNARPWRGEAIGEKWSKVSGWWIEVRDDHGLVWSIHEMHVRADTLF